MTRFARARGSKACNERREEEATPWHVMRQQLADKLNCNDKKASEITYNVKSLLSKNSANNKSEVWSDFGECKPETAVSTSKNIKKNQTCKLKLSVQKNAADDVSDISHKKNETGGNIVKVNNKRKFETLDEVTVKTCSKKKNKSIDVVKAQCVSEHDRSDQLENDFKPCKAPKENNILPHQELVKVYKQKNHSKNKSKPLPNQNCVLKHENPSVPRRISGGNSNENTQEDQDVKAKNVKTNLENAKHVAGKEAVVLSKDLKPGKIQINSNFNDWHPKNNKTNFQRSRFNNNVQSIFANDREIKVKPYEGFLVKAEDAKELTILRKKLKSENIPQEQIKQIMKLERRKAEKSLAREKTKVCFHCRKFGHKLSDCPEIDDKDLAKSGMCFKCGSTEHSYFDCKVSHGQDFRHAVCFVCKEQGHISRQCPLNPQGQYPKGGSCHLCGEVTHLRRDCPKAKEEQANANNTVNIFTNNDIEEPKTVIKNTQKKKSIVKF